MGKGIALLVGLGLLLAGWLYLSRGAPAIEPRQEGFRSPPSASVPPAAAPSEASPPSEPSGADAEPAGSAREPVERAGVGIPSLRGRVLDEAGEPLAGWNVRLRFVDENLALLRTDMDGRFETWRPLREGTTLSVLADKPWRVEPEELELDRMPEEELTFVAHPVDEARGLVRGVVVEELDGTPIPYLGVEVDGEACETDADGRFETVKAHPAGSIPFTFPALGQTFEYGAFDPARTEPLLIPAWGDPAVYVEIRGTARELAASWCPTTGTSLRAAGLFRDPRNQLRTRLPTLVRLRSETPGEGVLLLWSEKDLLAGRATLAPAYGTPDAPLPVDLQTCGLLNVRVKRAWDWSGMADGPILLQLSDEHGEQPASVPVLFDSGSFVVFDSGDFLLEAELDGKPLAQVALPLRVGEIQVVELPLRIPEAEEPGAAYEGVDAEEDEVRVPVSGTLTSIRNRPTMGGVRFARHDGEEAFFSIEWTKERGRWLGSFHGEAPPGELRVAVGLDPHYTVSGPSTLTLPSPEPLRFVIEDGVPLVDVFLDARAAENDTPLLAIDASLVLDDGDAFESASSTSPTVPVLRGHPCNVPFTWFCQAAGRVVASGRYAGQAEGGEVRIPVILARGWGAVFYALGPSSEPLEGVEVFLDGRRRGVTGSNGHVALAGECPRTLTLRYRDWHLSELTSACVDADGNYDGSWGYLGAWFEPPWR